MRQRSVLAGFSCPVVVAVAVALLAATGCAFKPSYVRGEKTAVPYRWKVEEVEVTRLSEDQRATFERRGPPTFVRFFRAVGTREPVYAWVYVSEEDSVDLVWFLHGKRLDSIAVDSNPSAFRATTRRRARTAVLVGTGAAIVPTVIFLVNR